MSLTAEDLQQIETIFDKKLDPVLSGLDQRIRSTLESVLDAKVIPRLEKLESEVAALRNDVKEIYDRLSGLQHSAFTDKQFKKLTLEQKLLTINAELLAAAKQAGIELPRS